MIPFKKLIPEAVIPTRGSAHAAGLDLAAAWEGLPDSLSIRPGQRMAVPTGLAVAIPYGWYGRVAPRSGLALKSGIDVLGGVIDADYRGEVKVILYNIDEFKVHYIEKGNKIAQLIIEKCLMQEPEEVSWDFSISVGRGASGFGSTGV